MYSKPHGSFTLLQSSCVEAASKICHQILGHACSSLCDFQNNHKIDLMIFSPNKPKNGGITAGIARAGTGKDSATGNGVDDSDEVRLPSFPQILFLSLVGFNCQSPGFVRSPTVVFFWNFCAPHSCFSLHLYLHLAILAAYEPSFSINEIS